MAPHGDRGGGEQPGLPRTSWCHRRRSRRWSVRHVRRAERSDQLGESKSRSFLAGNVWSSVHSSLQAIEDAVELVDVRHMIQLRRYVGVPNEAALVDHVKRSLGKAVLGAPNLITSGCFSLRLEVREQGEGETTN